MSDDLRIETLGHDSLAVSQENLYCVDKSTVPGTLQNESQEVEMQDNHPEGVIPEPYHLPECPMNLEFAFSVCICKELRACEQRVLDAAEQAVKTWVSYTFPAHRPGWTGKITAAIRSLKEKA